MERVKSEEKYEKQAGQKKLIPMKYIISTLEFIYKYKVNTSEGRIWLVDTWNKEGALEGYNGTRTSPIGKWADMKVKELYNVEGMSGLEHPVYFSYIKFGVNKDEVVGIAGCKSQFNNNPNPSDLNFDYKNDTPGAKKRNEFMGDGEKIPWYTEKVLILKNINDHDEAEALANERMLQALFNLFD